MAQTDVHGFSVQEKLNKRHLDVITVTLTTDAETIGDNKVFAQAIEIPFATALNGGTGVIKSITILDQTTTSPAMDIIFSSVNTSITQDEGKAVSETDSSSIYASAINRSGSNYVASATTVLRMKITIQKD